MDNESRKKILLVEDDFLLAMDEKQQLEKKGYTVHHVGNGEDAVNTILENKQLIDIILMDIDLGSGMDGTQAAEQILNHKDIPVLFLSSHTEPEIVEKTEKITSYGYVVKNSIITVLDASIKMAFKLFEAKVFHKNLEKELSENKTLMQAAFDQSPVAMAVATYPDYSFKIINKAAEDLLLISAEDFLLKTPQEIIATWKDCYESGDQIPFTELPLPAALQGISKKNMEIHVERHDGTKRIELASGAPIYSEDGKLLAGILVMTDITQSKQSEKQLKENNEELIRVNHIASIAENVALAGNWRFDVKTNIIYWSDSLCRIHGIDQKEFDGSFEMARKFIHPEDLENVIQKTEKSIHEKKSYSFEYRIITADGKEKYIYGNNKLIFDQDNNLSEIVGMNQDITERKLMEEELRKSKHQYQRISEMLSDYFYQITVANDGKFSLDFVSDNFYTITGRTKEEARTIESWSNIFYKDDMGKVMEFIKNLIVTHQPGELECRSYRNEHKLRWINIVAIPEWSEQENRVTSILGIVKDITERKQAEIALHESESTFRKLFEESSDAILLIDNTGVFVESNQAALNLLKMTRQQFIMLPPAMISPEYQPNGRLSSESAQEMIALAYTKGLHRFDWTCINSEGGEFIVEVSLMPVVIKGQTMLHTTWRDITKRKQTEKEIERQLSEKETLLKEVHHRIKNNISSIESFLSLQVNSSKNSDVKAALQDAISRVKSMRVLYDKLLIGKGYHEVSIKNYSESLIDSIVDLFPDAEKVTIEKRISDFNLSTKKLVPVGIILNEILTNVFKYAFKGKDNGHITIILDKTENHINLTILDNGNGIDNEIYSNQSHGLGLLIVKMLTQQLNGTFNIENYKGTRSVLKFDI